MSRQQRTRADVARGSTQAARRIASAVGTRKLGRVNGAARRRGLQRGGENSGVVLRRTAPLRRLQGQRVNPRRRRLRPTPSDFCFRIVGPTVSRCPAPPLFRASASHVSAGTSVSLHSAHRFSAAVVVASSIVLVAPSLVSMFCLQFTQFTDYSLLHSTEYTVHA